MLLKQPPLAYLLNSFLGFDEISSHTKLFYTIFETIPLRVDTDDF